MVVGKTIYLVDGSGYIFRAYYAIRRLTTRDGMPTNAVLGFARMLGKLLRQEKPTYLGIAFDPRGKTFRHVNFPDYKANREAAPEDLIPQFALIRELVRAMDIPVLEVPGFEADDVLATMTAQALARDMRVVVVSADKDLMQLVGPKVLQYDPMKDKRFDSEAVEEKLAVKPSFVADLLALAGDSSDNIPGVPKVGLKSAAKLIQAFGDVEAVIQGVTRQAKLRQTKLKAYEKSLLEHTDKARLSKELTLLRYDVPLDFDEELLRYTRPDPQKLGPFLQKIEARTLLKDFGLEVVPGENQEISQNNAPAPSKTDNDLVAFCPADNYQLVLNLDLLQEAVNAVRLSNEMTLQFFSMPSQMQGEDLIGVALSAGSSWAGYIPLGHRYIGAPPQVSLPDLWEALTPLLEDPQFLKKAHGLKKLFAWGIKEGFKIQGKCDDALLAAYVSDPSRASFSLDNLARHELGYTLPALKDIVGHGRHKRPIDEIEVETFSRYATQCCDVARVLTQKLSEDVGSTTLHKLYRDIEMPLIPILAEMEHHGIRINRQALVSLEEELGQRISQIEKEAQELVGEPFNLASPKQLGLILFEKLGYPVGKKTKTGYSTDHSVLESLAQHYELPQVILNFRSLAKLKSTYVDALQKQAHPESDRVHTSFNQSGASTGRLSSSDPNLQNIPIRSPEGQRIRQVFVPEDGYSLVSADYSQIELRILAHLSDDKDFIEAFKAGEDIHRRTAMEVLCDGQEPDSHSRRKAKAINFGILYGLSAFGLSRQLGLSNKEAQEIIDRYFNRYPRIRAFLDATVEQATRDAFVTTLSGRRRFIPDISSRNRNIRQAAQRVAMNTPIQGSAADLIKMAMIKVKDALDEHEPQARLLLQVHDELVLEVPRGRERQCAELLRNGMSQVYPLKVPLIVDVGWGGNWMEAH
jgi:DNA polymerase I